MSTKSIEFKRILLKLSGEALLGSRDHGIDPSAALKIAKEIKAIQDLGIEIAIVVGGGNIFRGMKAAAKGMDRSTADYMGMLATIMNGMALHDAFTKIGVHARVQSALNAPQVAEPFIRKKAIRHMEKKRVVILSGGTGSPYFTTDTGAALRAVELKADVILKATKVDGIYDKDPLKYSDAIRFPTLSYDKAIEKRLEVMDMTAFTMCRDNKIPIIVFDFFATDNLLKVVKGQKVGTAILP